MREQDLVAQETTRQLSANNAIEQFFGSEEFGTLESSSQRCYRGELQQFLKFLSARNISRLNAITPEAIISYLRSYQDITAARKGSILRKFFNWARDEKLMDKSPKIVTPKLEKPGALHPLTREEECKLLAEAAKKNPRDLALFASALETGADVREIVVLDVGDVIRIDDGKIGLQFKGKKESRNIPVSDSTSQVLAELVEGQMAEEALFLDKNHQRLTRQGFWLILQNYRKKIGRNDLCPQTLRHTFITNFPSNSTSELAEILGIRETNASIFLQRRGLTSSTN